MITTEELEAKIDTVCAEFNGQFDDLYSAIGLAVVGQRYGWRVMRLAGRRKDWANVNRFFGDPKSLFEERPPLSRRSLGFVIVEGLGNFWDVIRNGPGQLTKNQLRSISS